MKKNVICSFSSKRNTISKLSVMRKYNLAIKPYKTYTYIKQGNLENGDAN